MRRDQLSRVFAVVRFDRFFGPVTPIEHPFTVVRVMQDEGAAMREVVRLNDVNKDKDCRYYMQVTRWQSAVDQDKSEPSD